MLNVPQRNKHYVSFLSDINTPNGSWRHSNINSNNPATIIQKEEAEAIFHTLLELKAETMIDKRLHGNLRKGATFEAYIFLLIQHIIRLLGLNKVLKVTHNCWTYRKYMRSKYESLNWKKDTTVDLIIWKKKCSNWTPLIAIECKCWLTKWLSPHQFKTHIQKRFSNITNATRLLISKGIRYGHRTAQLLQLHQIQHITANIQQTINQTVSNTYKNIVNNMYKSVQLHKTQIINKHIMCFVKQTRSNFQHNIIGSVGYG